MKLPPQQPGKMVDKKKDSAAVRGISVQDEDIADGGFLETRPQAPKPTDENAVPIGNSENERASKRRFIPEPLNATSPSSRYTVPGAVRVRAAHSGLGNPDESRGDTLELLRRSTNSNRSTSLRRSTNSNRSLRNEDYAGGLAEAYIVTESEREGAKEEPTVGETEPRKNRRCSSIKMLLIAVIVVASAVIAAVVVSSRGTSPDNAPDTVTQRTASPTRAPLGTDELAEMIFPTSRPTTELDPHQLLALTWLSKDPQVLNYSVYRLQQRYVLAVLYDNLAPRPWSNDDGWLTYSDECAWYPASRISICSSSGEYTSIELPNNTLFGILPSDLELLTSLRILNASENGIFGTIPATLWSFPELHTVNLAGNSISGSLPAIAFTDTSIEETMNTTAADDSQRRLRAARKRREQEQEPPLQRLFFGRNRVGGSLPKSIGLLKNLTVLSLEENKFVGQLPSEMGLLNQLHFLNVSSNKFSGSIPKEM
jgi:hypothetical protein